MCRSLQCVPFPLKLHLLNQWWHFPAFGFYATKETRKCLALTTGHEEGKKDRTVKERERERERTGQKGISISFLILWKQQRPWAQVINQSYGSCNNEGSGILQTKSINNTQVNILMHTHRCTHTKRCKPGYMILNGMPARHVCSARNSAKLVLQTFPPWSLMMFGCVLGSPGNDSHCTHAHTPARTRKVRSLLQTLPVSEITELIGNVPLVNFKHCFQSLGLFFFFFWLHPPAAHRSSSRNFFQKPFTPMGMGAKWKRFIRFHMLVLGQHSSSISATFFVFSHFSPPFVVSSSYYFQSAGKRCISTHSWSPFWLFWWQYMQKAKRDEDDKQPTNCEFQPRGSHSDWTIATESQREYMGTRSALSRGNTQRLGLLFSLWAWRKWALCFMWVTNHSFYILDLLSLTFFPQFNSVSLACLPFAYLAPSSPQVPTRLQCILAPSGSLPFQAMTFWFISPCTDGKGQSWDLWFAMVE